MDETGSMGTDFMNGVLLEVIGKHGRRSPPGQPRPWSPLSQEVRMLGGVAFKFVRTPWESKQQPVSAQIKAASQSEFRTACAVTRGNLFAQILSKQTQTCRIFRVFSA